MIRNYYINKEWMLSSTAHRIYRTAAMFSLMLFFLLLVRRWLPGLPLSVLPLVRVLILTGVVGTATTMVAMEYFLFGFDKSSAWKKVFWFCAMLVPPLGAPLYCFIVYSRAEVLKPAVAGQMQTPS